MGCAKLRFILSLNLAIRAVQILIRISGAQDRFTWPFTKDGNYSVKLGYQFIKQRNTRHVNNPSTSTNLNLAMWKFIWNIPYPKKVKLFLWRACHNAITTRENLFKQRLVSSSLCRICNQQNEMIEHALLLCPWTIPIWFSSILQLLPTTKNVERLNNWICKVINAMKVNTEFLN